MAVYTEVTAEEIAELLKRYDIGRPVSMKGIAEGVENTNYLLTTERGDFILTLYEKRVACGDLPFFIALLDHLATRDVPCPVPIRDRDDQALQTLCGRSAALFTFLKGISVRRPSVAHCAAVGTALAKLHLAGREFPMRRENSLSLAGWQRLREALGPKADEVWSGLGALLDSELETLSRKWPADLPEGIIHADLFPDNVLVYDGSVSGIIDFYFACDDLLAYDVAICLNAWCFENDHSFNITKARAFLEAYRSVRPMSAAETGALPILARGAALRFLLTRAYDWFNTTPEAYVRPKSPEEYLRKLRFHQRVGSLSEYGITS
ncbi:MAG: homoserine kinase [Dichotomicrobium sp.]